MDQDARMNGAHADVRASAVRRPSPDKHTRSSSNASVLLQVQAKGRNGEKPATSSSVSAKGAGHALGRSKPVRLPSEPGGRDASVGEIKSRDLSRSSMEGDVKRSAPPHSVRQTSRMAPPSSFPGSRSINYGQNLTEIRAPQSHPRLSDAASNTSSRSTSNGSQNATSATASSRRRESTRSSLSTGTSAQPLPLGSRHGRSSSTAAAEMGKPASRTSMKRNSFTTYQQDFVATQSSRIRTSSVATARSTSGSTAAAPTTINRKKPQSQSHQTAQPQAPNTTVLRQQTHLLHLSLLHASHIQTLQAYNFSARSHLLQLFTDLQSLYKSLLSLRRTARQSRNLLALHDWSGGNTAALVRKLNVFTAILAELCELTRPESSASVNVNVNVSASDAAHDTAVPQSNQISPANPHTPPNPNQAGPSELARKPEPKQNQNQNQNQEEGHYTLIVSAFSLWVAWVSEVWAERDVVRFTSTEVLGEMQKPPESAMLPIEGLGDGMKAEIKGLAGRVEGIVGALEGLDGGAGAVGGRQGAGARGRSGSPVKGMGPASEGEGQERESQKSTLAVLMGLASELVKGMREELQMMREIEFEVLYGEKAWLDEQVRRAGEQVDGW